MIILYEKNIFTKYFSHSQKHKKKGEKHNVFLPIILKVSVFQLLCRLLRSKLGWSYLLGRNTQLLLCHRQQVNAVCTFVNKGTGRQIYYKCTSTLGTDLLNCLVGLLKNRCIKLLLQLSHLLLCILLEHLQSLLHLLKLFCLSLKNGSSPS